MTYHAGMEATSANDNGQIVRDQRGRFGPGNKAAVGRVNPHADRVRAWRSALAATVTEDDLHAVIVKLVERAKAGERWAVCELLDRCLGKPVPQSDPADAEDTGPVTLVLALDKPLAQR